MNIFHALSNIVGAEFALKRIYTKLRKKQVPYDPHVVGNSVHDRRPSPSHGPFLLCVYRRRLSIATTSSEVSVNACRLLDDGVPPRGQILRNRRNGALVAAIDFCGRSAPLPGCTRKGKKLCVTKRLFYHLNGQQVLFTDHVYGR